MRVLVATTAGSGHFGPLSPFARALVEGGHDVVVTAPASFKTAVERAGFVHQPFADAPDDEQGAVLATLAGVSNERGNDIVIAEIFGRINTRAALADTEALMERWRPDLVLREPSEFSSYIAAEAAGVPHAQVSCGLAAFEARIPRLLEAPLAELAPGCGVAGLQSAPRLTLVPSSFEDPAHPGLAMRFRDGTAPAAADGLPDWWPGLDGPLVYVTFGSVAGSLGLYPDLYRGVADALANLPIRVLLTTGDVGDPELLLPLPPNVHVEAWWPQQDVMAHAAAMVGHGGFGTTLIGLAAGMPMVVLPLFADQPDNARRVHEIGAGIALDGGPAGVRDLAAAVERVVGDASFRSRAEAIADDIAALPPVAEAVPLLEKIATQGPAGSVAPDGR